MADPKIENEAGANVSTGAPADTTAQSRPEVEGFKRVGGNVPDTDAGKEFGEGPAPIPAKSAKKKRPVVDTEAQVRQDTVYIQGVPEQPAPQPSGVAEAGLTDQVLTASAVAVAPVGAGGLSELARLYYGDVAYAADIFDANRDRLTNPDSVIVGQLLRLPQVKRRS